MKKLLLPITLLMLAGCANPELTKKVTAEFTSQKDANSLAVCIAEKSDKRTFNGLRIETVSKPTRESGIALVLINGNGYIDILDKGAQQQVVYRGEAANSNWGKLTNRNGEVISDIKSCL
ncbi:hypothetical protein [Serratia marcescens]|uniref:hypothetical protein n=1 Tax=Serratia marcescens TaxID=615 RepID=UPI00320A5422